MLQALVENLEPAVLPVLPGPAILRDLAIAAKVCARPILLRCTDTETGTTTSVPIPCGATSERTCPSCADRARRLRMQQCREGWHREDEPDPDDRLEDHVEDELEDLHDAPADTDDASAAVGPDDLDEGQALEGNLVDSMEDGTGRRVRSTRRRHDAADLPRLPMDARTTGKVFRTREGKTYRPSMFLTFTLPSYGAVRPDGTPVDPDRYDYQRAALDALHFAKLEDRLWQNLRRCAGYKVQYFAAIEAQRRLAPHLHAAVRGVIPRQIVRQVVAGTYHQLWWPPCSEPLYADGDPLPVWMSTRRGSPTRRRGLVLPSWEQALDDLDADLAAKPAHVLRFGRQFDYQGIIATNENEVGRAVAYLTKYLAKDLGATHDDPDELTTAQAAHLDRLHAHVQVLPCSRGARTGSATACNPRVLAHTSNPGAAAPKPTTGTTSASAAVESTSPGNGPERR